LVRGSKLILQTGYCGSFRELLASLRASRSQGGFTLVGDYSPAAACLAVPAPVNSKNPDAVFYAPNIAWPIRAADFSATSNIPCALINDFAAQGLAGLFPDIFDLETVLAGKARDDAPAVMLGPGTGLGKAVILPGEPSGGGRAAGDTPQSVRSGLFVPGGRAEASRVLPSEGGHSLFPFKGPEEEAFQEFLLRLTGRREATGDMVVTGSGLAALYAFHNGDDFLRPAPEIAAEIREASLAPSFVSGAGSPAARSLEWLARFLGRAARNFVLEVMALGGVYLSGGMPGHVPALLGHGAFEAEFRGSESQKELLKEVPVSLVSNQETGLWGAALHALRLPV
jgi:glucokinase